MEDNASLYRFWSIAQKSKHTITRESKPQAGTVDLIADESKGHHTAEK